LDILNHTFLLNAALDKADQAAMHCS